MKLNLEHLKSITQGAVYFSEEEKGFQPHRSLFEDVGKTIHSICEEIGGITVIDGFDFVPKEPTLFADLCLHPSNEGFDHYIKNPTAEIRKYV